MENSQDLSLCNEQHRSKKAKKIFLALLTLVFFTFLYHRYEACWQCGAVRHVFLTTLWAPNLFIEENPEKSEICKRLLGGPCLHEHYEPLTTWVLIVHGHSRSKQPIRELRLQKDLNIIPNQDWQRQAFLAIGSKQNLLKWVALTILRDLQDSYPESEEDWQIWWKTNREAFEVTTDLVKGRTVAKALLDQYSKDGLPILWERYEHEIQTDLNQLEIN